MSGREGGSASAPQRIGRVAELRESLSASLWPVPVVAVAVALVAGVLVPRVDAALDGELSPGTREVLFSGGPDAARTVLSAVSGSLITVTSLTFSLTVVTLQLASSQFSPRLLRSFSSDRFVHVTLALFLATFVYGLVVLRTVRDDTDEQIGFVPRIAVTVAVVLTVAAVAALVLFLAHLARQIRVETMLQDVQADTIGTLDRVLPHRRTGGEGPAAAPPVPARALPVEVDHAGFLISLDEGDLLQAAIECGAVVSIETHLGTQVVARTPVGRAWFDAGDRVDPEAFDRLRGRISRAVRTGSERTATQDVGYGLRQMTDVAVKALSPGINDPTTAVHAMGHLAAVLCELTDRQLGSKVITDDSDRVRVLLARPTFAELLDQAIAQPRRYGADAPDLLLRLARLLREVAWRARDDEQRAAVTDQLQRLRETVSGGDLKETEKRSLHAAAGRVQDALEGRW